MTPDSATWQLVQARIAEYAQEHPRAATTKANGVRIDNEFDRINGLRRRTWSDADANALVDALTPILKRPGGTQTLRPLQAISLYEIAEQHGLLSPLRPGAGKTLITFLAPVILGARKPLLILPAKLIPKTKRELIQCASHWRVATNIAMVSYEWLGRVQAADYLMQTQPDLIMCDEAHKIRNRKAAVTRRVTRYFDKRNPMVIPLSGTLIRKRILDWAHLGKAALGDRSPAPLRWNTIEHWGNSLDFGATAAPGVLSRWCEPGEDVRSAYRRRIVETPGVVASAEGLLGVALNIEAWHTDLPPVIVNALATLRHDWTLPDGMIITDPLEYYRKARQLALGVYYRWKEQPPTEWRERRKAWGAFVRHANRYLRDNGRPFDSEHQVALACLNGKIDRTDYDAWREVRDTFKPITEHVWITYDIVERLIREACTGDPCIVWVEQRAVGNLIHLMGMPYYGRKGLTPDKRDILDADPAKSMACSIRSIGEGHNLQAWARGLVSAPIQDANLWEQMLARFHRDGQEADEVNVQVAMYDQTQRDSWEKAIEHAEFLELISGQDQKILNATLVGMP